MAEETIFIVYSNSTTLWGQLAYGVRRMSATVAGTPCAALELTHGGLGSSERPEWGQAKKEIPVALKQQHFDEISPDVSSPSDSPGTISTPFSHVTSRTYRLLWHSSSTTSR